MSKIRAMRISDTEWGAWQSFAARKKSTVSAEVRRAMRLHMVTSEVRREMRRRERRVQNAETDNN